MKVHKSSNVRSYSCHCTIGSVKPFRVEDGSEENPRFEDYKFESIRNLEEQGGMRCIVETIYPASMNYKQEACEIVSQNIKERSKLKTRNVTSCDYPRSSLAHTNKLKHSCNICHQSYLTRTSLKEHTKNHTQEEIKCGLCGYLLKNEHVLRAHMDIHKEVQPLPCGLCNKVFLFASSLEQHTKYEHETNNPVEIVSVFYTCQICGKSFKNLQNLRMHERQIHLGIPKQHICECCGAMFYSGSKLRLHMLRHTGERPFTCEICGLRFGTKHRLGNHLVCHSEARPHACGVCGKTFKRQRNLGMHEQNSHGVFSQGASKEKVVISFSCQMCKKHFTTKQKLAVHMREHTGERPFRCDICGKVLSSKMGKKNHIRTHTGERPYKCNRCELALKTHAQLYSHLQTHSENKPFSCSYCQKMFRRRPHLVSHLRTHTGEKPYSCTVCDRAFSQKADMRKHMDKIHTILGSSK